MNKRENRIEEYLEMVKEHIVNQINPDKIVLFGSYARGDYNSNSDIDLIFIVDNKDESKRDIKHQIDRLLQDRWLPTDIFVYTEDEFREEEGIIGTLPHEIKEESEVLYDKRG